MCPAEMSERCVLVSQLINKTKKTAITDLELERLNINIGALDQTGLLANSILRERKLQVFPARIGGVRLTTAWR